jgi:hypothetical protein
MWVADKWKDYEPHRRLRRKRWSAGSHNLVRPDPQPQENARLNPLRERRRDVPNSRSSTAAGLGQGALPPDGTSATRFEFHVNP